jgi:para-nitrobenzyl esterase
MSAIASTGHGRVEGLPRGAHVVFRGIPFARPPVGALRFRAPEPPEPWAGVRVARSFGGVAPQGATGAPGMRADGEQSEDCLYLNVYTPALDGKRRPVMFWIHGGAFTLGSASQPIYDGRKLAERGDVVVVTTNYRLGALGYAYLGAHGDWGASANLGQLDQIAALRWVRENIESFGGDPGNVTIFGESAGSMAVCTLLAMPAAAGLFQRAIAQSGASLTLTTADQAAKVTESLLAELGIPENESQRLQDVPVEQLLRAQEAAARNATNLRGFAPVLDLATVPRQPGAAFAAGAGADVPLVIGTNRDEMNLFNAPMLRELDKPMEDARAVEVLRKALPARAGDRAQALLEVYRASRTARGLPSTNRALLGAIQSDLRFRIPSVRYAEAYRARNPNTFMYLFTYESPAMRGALRACHALEIPFVFGTLDAPFQDKFAGKGPAVEALSEQMMDAWLGFARRSQPSHPRLGDWIPYDTSRRATMVFDSKSSLTDAPYEEERAAWDGIAL